jgi:hypothetical protein
LQVHVRPQGTCEAIHRQTAIKPLYRDAALVGMARACNSLHAMWRWWEKRRRLLVAPPPTGRPGLPSLAERAATRRDLSGLVNLVRADPPLTEAPRAPRPARTIVMIFAAMVVVVVAIVVVLRFVEVEGRLARLDAKLDAMSQQLSEAFRTLRVESSTPATASTSDARAYASRRSPWYRRCRHQNHPCQPSFEDQSRLSVSSQGRERASQKI